jgi:hypothetical protein
MCQAFSPTVSSTVPVRGSAARVYCVAQVQYLRLQSLHKAAIQCAIIWDSDSRILRSADRGAVRRGGGGRGWAYPGSTRAVQEAYMNPLISPSLPSFCSLVAQPAASREFPAYFQSFPRARDGHLCAYLLYLCANTNLPRSNPASSTRSSAASWAVQRWTDANY